MMNISYFGKDAKISTWIHDFIPKQGIKTFAEPFSGAMWVYLNPKLDYDHIPNIRYNDFDKHNTNLYACFQDYNQMINVIEKSLKSGLLSPKGNNPEEYRQHYKKIYNTLKNDNMFLGDVNFNIPNYDIALKYAYLITSAYDTYHPMKTRFSGINKANKKYPLGNLKINSLLKNLKNPKFQNKFERITSFENLDFEELIKKYDGNDTFFYLDPPNDDTFSYDEHKRLSKLLLSINAKWLLLYDNPEITKLYPKNLKNKENKLIFNYDLTQNEQIKITGIRPEKNKTKFLETPKDIDHFWAD